METTAEAPRAAMAARAATAAPRPQAAHQDRSEHQANPERRERQARPVPPREGLDSPAPPRSMPARIVTFLSRRRFRIRLRSKRNAQL